MKLDRVLACIVVIALGITPLMALTAQATVTGTQILDSQADITTYDFSGDYVAYYGAAVGGVLHVNLYNYKTDTVQSIFNSSNLGSVAIEGNDVTFTDRSTPAEAKLNHYNIATKAITTLVTYVSFYSFYNDVGDGHVMYADTVNYGNYTEQIVRVKTVSGTQVWSRNETNEFVFDFNINNGYAMYSDGDGIRVYSISTDTSFYISDTSGGFCEMPDTDGTTIIFREGGEYPNEYTKMVTYDIATKSKKTFSVPNSATQFKICNGMIYYLDGDFANDHIYWMNVDGTGVEQVSDSYVHSAYLKVEAGKAVVKDQNDGSVLHMYDTAGMGGGTTPPTTGNVIGTLGGTITKEGAVLDVPAGSLSGDVEFSLNKLTVDNSNILSAFQLLPNDIAFDPPATLTMDIPGTRAAGNELMRLEDGQWVSVSSTPSNDGSSLIAQISQTGTYAVTVLRDTATQAIGTAGGLVSIPDVSLDIPANALASLTDVSIEETFVDAANVAQAVAVNIGGAILSVPAQLNFDIPSTVDSATAQVGQLIGNSWIEVESALNDAGQLVASITEGGIYALISGAEDAAGGLIPFPSGTAVLAIMLTTGLAMAVVRRRYYRK